MSDESYKCQVSLRFGPGQVGMLNLRANSLDELGQLMGEALDGVVANAGLMIEQFAAVGIIAEAMPATAVVQQQPAQTRAPDAQQAPLCTHGAMTWREDRGGQWAGWFCRQPSSAPDRCKPRYEKQQGR